VRRAYGRDVVLPHGEQVGAHVGFGDGHGIDCSRAEGRLKQLSLDSPVRKESDDITAVEVARNGPEAIAAVKAQRPDLLFLDVQMPGVDGFGVPEALGPAETPPTIFVTPPYETAAAPFHPWAPRHEEALSRWLDGLLPFLEVPRAPETKEAIERIVRMNATPAMPHLERLLAREASLDPAIKALAEDALDFLAGRRTPAAWKRWRAEDAPP